MSVEEKISKELAQRKKRDKSPLLPEIEMPRAYEPLDFSHILKLAQKEIFHLEAKSDAWALATIGLVAFITMFAFLGLWPKAEAGWFARVLWKLILAGSIGAIALLFSRTQERIQKRVTELVGIVNERLAELPEKFRAFKLESDYFDSDAMTKLLFIKATAAVAAVSIVFII